MLGGESDAISKSMPVFESFGALMPHLGPVGSGQNAKLINNAMLAANMAIADHALASAAALGIEQQALLELLKASSGQSFGLEVRGRIPSPQAFTHGGTLLFKDLRILRAVLGDERGATGLWNAAEAFLLACTGEDQATTGQNV